MKVFYRYGLALTIILTGVFFTTFPPCAYARLGSIVVSSSQADSTSKQPNQAPSKLKITQKKERGFIRRQLEQLIGTKESAHESGFLVFPTFAYAPETRWDFGINTLYVYFANDRIENRLSECSKAIRNNN